uniref:Exportin-5 C-terminal domain-containing protein n=1 Tax=Leersia perrieri TaxID=77586 RepID=A0A0D9XW99_9ORYZ
MLVNIEMMSSHQKMGSLLLMEHNAISQAFLVVISYSRIHQSVELIPCLLSLLNKIWTLPEWRSRFLQHGSGLNCLFSDDQFLKMVHYMVRLCEVKIRRDCTEVFSVSKPYTVTFVRLILPLIVELLQCIHWLWDPPIAYTLSEVLERAKYPDPYFQFQHSTKLFGISDREGSQEKDTRELIEGIRESGHLRKLIKLTVIPLVKNCPRKFWKELVDNILRKLLRHCEGILHFAWFELLYDVRAGASYYFGTLSGVKGRIKTLERDILLEFTREVSGLLEVVALTEQSRELSLEDKEAILFQDSMPSTSLLRYLVINDCFGNLRMGLFGHFVDDTATEKAIPFCRALVRLACGSNDARLRIFILDNLLPCLIQRLDNKLPCAIQSLKSELSSSGSDNASKGLLALIEGDKNSDNFQNCFEVWLEWQKEDFRAKAYSSAVREVSFGDPWKWENICVDKACLFQKLRPEFRAKYAINSPVHPYMDTILSIQHRKFCSMAPVVRKRKICNLVHQLIKLKPYIKGSDPPYDVIDRLRQTSEIPAEFSKYVAPSVQLLRSVLFFWEPRFHPMIREAQINELSAIVDRLTATECLEPLVPTARDFPFHLKPYARDFIGTKLTESKDTFMEFSVNEVVPSKFRALECSLIKLSFERRAEVVYMQTDICTYADCLLRLLVNEPLKVQAQCLISQLEAEGFFDVDSNRVDWGKASFSELVGKFNSELLSRNSLPKHYAIRGLIVVVDVRNSLTGCLEKFWKDTRSIGA